jgi:5-carboxyvanillate decarboxylase
VKIIDTEAHFFSAEYQDYLISRKMIPREIRRGGAFRLVYSPGVWEPHGQSLEAMLLETGESRIRRMDSAGIGLQVLSLATPGCEQFDVADGIKWSRNTNEYLSEMVSHHGGRFIGLASLAPQDAEAAARELERGVCDLGLKGAKINSHVGRKYLDARQFWPVFEAAERLDVPLFIHPYAPNPSFIKAFAGYGFALAGPAWGFGVEAATCALRLIYSGIFDRYPRLKIVLGHLGEGLAYWTYRIDFSFRKEWMGNEARPNIKNAPSEYLRRNFYLNNSGMCSVPAFLCVLAEMGADHMMFGSDHPFEDTAEAKKFAQAIPIPEGSREKIFHAVAESLFKINP